MKFKVGDIVHTRKWRQAVERKAVERKAHLFCPERGIVTGVLPRHVIVKFENEDTTSFHHSWLGLVSPLELLAECAECTDD